MKHLLACLLAFTAPAFAAKPPVAWHVDPPKPARPGARLQLTLTGQLDPGWHLYALQEPEGGPIATTVALTEGDPAELAEVTEAKPATARDPAFDAPTSFFDRTAVFHLRAAVARNAQPGQQTLHILVRYQSCNGQVCLPPRTDTVPVPLTIQP